MRRRTQQGLAAEAKFRARVGQLGAVPAPGATWRGVGQPFALVCRRKHQCAPRPGDVFKGTGICRTCAGRDPDAAAVAFVARVENLGGTLAPGAAYVDAQTPVAVICSVGHACHPSPTHVQQGRDLCAACSGMGSALSAAKFAARVANLGGTFAPGAVYVNNHTPVALRCRRGHPCAPRPHGVLQGQGLCARCCAQDGADQGEAAFRESVTWAGATFGPGAVYVNTHTPVVLVCALGHACSPRPSDVQKGQGICRVCAAKDPATAQADFRERVATQGAVFAPGATYAGAALPVPLICAGGHECAPRPNSVQQGGGVCGQCAVSFDRVYLLEHASTGAIKVGIASGDARVIGHVGRKYHLVAQWLGLNHVRASAVEKQVIAFWRNNGWAQVEGAPRDGRTETTAAEHLSATLAWLTDLLGSST